jgi:ornithine decarboxylase
LVGSAPVVLAGPTCDSPDILYERTAYQLPLDLQIGDKIQFLPAGAYTWTYASIGFNGFEPLRSFCI